jgi:hypothetical protein
MKIRSLFNKNLAHYFVLKGKVYKFCLKLSDIKKQSTEDLMFLGIILRGLRLVFRFLKP